MTGEKWTIYWTEYSSDTYLYGTELIFHNKNDIEITNHLMPPGTIMKQWYSKTNFQTQKIEPTLPMIDGEGEYQITVNLDCPKGESCLIRLVFYDRYDEEVSCITLRDKSMKFKCPLKTYSYRMQLINGGVTHLHFHSVVIQEIIDEVE